MTTLDPDRHWQADAICARGPTAPYETATHYTEARAACAVCPVRDICLPDALLTDDHKYPYGVRAGAGPKARRQLKAANSPAKLKRERDAAIARWRAGEPPRLHIVVGNEPPPPRPARPCDDCGVPVPQQDRGRPRLRCEGCETKREAARANSRRVRPRPSAPPRKTPVAVAPLPAPDPVPPPEPVTLPPVPLSGVVVDGNRWRCVQPCNTPWIVCWGSVDPYTQSAEHSAGHGREEG